MREPSPFWRLAWRHARQAPRLTAALVLTVAVGVASYLSVRLANRAAVASFAVLADNLTGPADGVIEPLAGQLPESLLPRLREALDPLPVQLHPQIEGTVSWRRADGSLSQRGGVNETFRLVGLDLISVINRASFAARDNRLLFQRPDPGAEAPAAASSFWTTLRDPRAIWIAPRLAEQEGLQVGDTLELLVNDRFEAVRIAGLLPEDAGRPRHPRTLLVGDLPAIRTLLGREGWVDRVDVVVEEGAAAATIRREVAQRLAEGDAHGWRYELPEQGRAAGEVMTQAFRLNLLVLSLIALVVGLYLIAQGLDAAVARRRSELAILRSLGVTPATLRRLWLAEAAVLGALGGTLGVILGWAGAQLSVRGVAQTVDALYGAATAAPAHLRWDDVLLGLALGIGAAVLAGAWPAARAARTPPAQLLGRGQFDPGPWVLRRPWLGVALLAWGAVLAGLPPLSLGDGYRFPLAGYLAAICWIVGASMAAASSLPLWGWLFGALRRVGPVAAMGLGRLRRPTGRHRFAVAGLVVAVGMAAGMTLLIHSFETTMRSWISQALQGDLYVASAGATSASSRHRLSPETVAAMTMEPGIRSASAVAFHPLRLPGGETVLVGADRDSEVADFVWLVPPQPGVRYLSAAGAVEPVWVSEAFTVRFGARVGQMLDLPTPFGPRAVIITAIFADYGNERGSLIADRAVVAEWFNDPTVSRVAFMVEPGTDAEAIQQRWLDRFPGLEVRTQAGLRAEVLRIFRQTFSITWALQALGLAVAVAGLGLALVTILHESRADLTTLRALGFHRRQLARLTQLEGLVLATLGTIGGLLLALLLGGLLIYVINRQSFGWTLAYDIPWRILLIYSAGLIALAALVAGAIGRWSADLPADREE